METANRRAKMKTDQFRQELIEEIIDQIQNGTHNTFAMIAEAACGKEKADQFRLLAIAEGKWIKMNNVIYNS